MLSAPFSSLRARVLLAAVLTLLLVPPLLEAFLRGIGVGQSTRYWLEYGDDRTLVANPRFFWRDMPARTAPDPVREFVKMPKPGNEFRVVVVGDGTAHGFPNPAHSWPRLLELMLAPLNTNLQVRVINAGLPFCDAATAAGVLEESLALQPDAVVFALGAQEFMAANAPGFPFDSGLRGVEEIQDHRSAAGRRLRQWWRGEPFTPAQAREWTDLVSVMSEPTAAAGPESARAPVRERVGEAVRWAAGGGVWWAAARCARARVPLLVATPVCNVADLPPFRSVAADGKPLPDHPELLTTLAAAREHYQQGRWDEGMAALAPLLAAHPNLAEAHYLAGRLHMSAKRDDASRASFLAAWNADALPLRGDLALVDAVRAAAPTSTPDTVLVDFFGVLSAASAGRYKLPGGAQFHDHAHLNFTGAHLCARAVAEALLNRFPERLAGAGKRKPALAGRAALAKRAGYTVVGDYLDRQEGHTFWTGPLFQALSDAKERLEQRKFELAQTQKDSTHDPNPGEAVEAVRQALAERPRDTWLMKGLVEHLFMDNKLGEVENQLTELNMRLPFDLRVLDRLRILFLNSNRPAQAFEAARLLLERNPDAMMPSVFYGVAFKGVTTNAVELLRYHEELLERYPKGYEVRRNLATAYAVAGQYEKAERHFLDVMKLRPEDDAPALSYAEMKMGQGKLSDALRILLEIAERSPGNAQARYMAGIVYSRADRILPAITEMQKALQISPVHEEAKKALAQLRAMQDERARQYFEEAQKLRAAKKYAEAMPLYLKALELFPEGMTLLENITFLYATCEDPAVRSGEKAVVYADRLLSLAAAPRFDNFATAAAAYAAAGNYSRAVELADRAVALADSLPQKPDLGKLRRALQAYQERRPFLENAN